MKGLETKDNVLTGKLTVIGTVGTMFIAALVSAIVSFLNPSATSAHETTHKEIRSETSVANMKAAPDAPPATQASAP